MRAPRARACSSASRSRKARALAVHEAVAVAGERPGGAGGSEFVGGERAHGGERGHDRGGDDGFGAPARATSTRPYRMRSMACPMASVPEAHALVTVRAWPVMCSASDTWEAAWEGTVIGVVSGGDRARTLVPQLAVGADEHGGVTEDGPDRDADPLGRQPALVVPAGSSPASCQASRAASTANWADRFIRRACGRGSSPTGSTGTLPRPARAVRRTPRPPTRLSRTGPRPAAPRPRHRAASRHRAGDDDPAGCVRLGGPSRAWVMPYDICLLGGLLGQVPQFLVGDGILGPAVQVPVPVAPSAGVRLPRPPGGPRRAVR